jgi:hypothetical protein
MKPLTIFRAVSDLALAVLAVASLFLLAGLVDAVWNRPPNTYTTAAEQAQHYAHNCQNIKQLADRRRLSDFTPLDLRQIAACKQLGLWGEKLP